MSIELKESQKVKLKKPKQYGVYLLNDDFTTFNFVIFVCQNVFNKNYQEADQIAMTIHYENKALAGVYSKEIAEFKKKKVEELSEENKFPFRAEIIELE